MIAGWLVFPLLLALLCAGCGAAVERLAGQPLPGPLLLPLGLAALVVVAHPFTLADATAELAAPAVVAVAVAGLLLTRRRPRAAIAPWPAACAAAVLAVYAAPSALSGEPTIAGYIKLDDSASWLALAERAAEQGTSYAGLGPSTYEAMLDFYLGGDYPLGGLLPLTVGGALLGADDIGLYQPFTAFVAAMLALCLYAIADSLIPSRPLRALAVFVAAQAALLYGYGLWGGTKEVATAWLVALLAALAWPAIRDRAAGRALLPLAVAGAATLSVLSLGGGVWLAPFLLAALLAVRRDGPRSALPRLGTLAGLVLVLAIPSLLGAGFLGSSAVPLTETSDRTGLANLIRPLSPLQALGIWPSGDFRLEPADTAPTYVLLAVAAAAALIGLAAAWRVRATTTLLYAGAAAAGALVVIVFGTAWIDAKALAALSPALVLLALGGAAAIGATGRRIEAVVVAMLVAGGVLWSNVVGYSEVQLTPAERFAELRAIGERIAGDGPTLMTEFEPYGPRFFLRDAEPEGASELRRRQILLRTGAPLERARSADIDAFQLPAVMTYRTLVVRRSPYASRPPSSYRLAHRGRFYEVWRRGAQPVAEHLPLGDVPPRCSDVIALARRGARLAYAAPPPAASRLPLNATRFTVDAAGEHEVWVGGSFRGRLEVSIDGRLVAERRHELSHGAPFTSVARVELAAGEHRLAVEHHTGGLHPGSSGRGFGLGPVVVSPLRDIDRVETLSARDARDLCGRRLDWIEALP